ncbi:MAG: hypothetical protein D6759_03250 [Chloroflexi bacterium]|nr:MAG: hypothetical protein D6759_03250 [Chloroflexota bacterium]
MFFGTDHSDIHRYMRRLGLKPYALFPGPSVDLWVAYVYPPARPAALLFHVSWSLSWKPGAFSSLFQTEWTQKEPAQLTQNLRREAEALANRLGCPVAPVLLIRDSYRLRLPSFLKPLAEEAQRRDVTLILLSDNPWYARLHWIEPAEPVEQPALPPYPDHTYWRASLDPAWWQEQLRTLAQADDPTRKSEAQRLSQQALTYVKEAPARYLLQGPTALRAAQEALDSVPLCLDRVAGRRYFLWTGFYLAAVTLVGLYRDHDADGPLLRFLHHTFDAFDHWTSREQRVILRGTEFLVQKSADLASPTDTPLSRFLTELFVRLLHPDFWRQPRKSFKFPWRVQELANAIARSGHLPAHVWSSQWSLHLERHTVLIEAYGGLIEHLVQQPSPHLWRTLAWTGFREPDLPPRKRRWAFLDCLRWSSIPPAFWDLVRQEERLLDLLLQITLDELESTYVIPPSPDALDALLSIVRERLQDPAIPTRLRDELQEAESKLAAARESIDWMEPE